MNANYMNPVFRQLRDQQVRFAPRDQQMEQANRAERLLGEIDPARVYAAGSVAPTRQRIFQYIAGTNRNGAEMPTFGVCGFGTFASLSNDFIGVVGSAGGEIYNIGPGSAFDSDADRPRSAFRALDVAGVPIYADPYCPEGTVYLINTNYLNLYVHEMAAFAFSGFESLISNYQIGYVGVVLTLCELVLTKPKTCSRVGGFTFLTL